MPKLISNYTQHEWDVLLAECRKVGMEPAVFQKHSTLLQLKRNNRKNINDLIKNMLNNPAQRK